MANAAPLPAPSATAITKNATVPSGASEGVKACTAAPKATGASNTRTAPIRSDNQPPTGRIRTATSTKPAIRSAASAWASP